MTYVMSDIHGEYQKFLEMMDRLRLGEDDVLFVLGDVIDRGPEPVALLTDLSMRHNVYPLMGNHEWMALDVLRTLLVEVTEENCETQITGDVLRKLATWQNNGGDVTLKQLRALPHEERMALVEYMEEFEPYALVRAGGQKFVLVHAGFDHYDPQKALGDYDVTDLLFARPPAEQIYYNESIRVIVGHTPTPAMGCPPQIFTSGNVTYIDCGATFNGRLACLRLDDGMEFYV